jgi:hypothetical protein
LTIAHEQGILVSIAYEEEMFFKMTNGIEVFLIISDEQVSSLQLADYMLIMPR